MLFSESAARKIEGCVYMLGPGYGYAFGRSLRRFEACSWLCKCDWGGTGNEMVGTAPPKTCAADVCCVLEREDKGSSVSDRCRLRESDAL